MVRVWLFLCSLTGVLGEPLSYKGHKVIRVIPETHTELTVLHDFIRNVTTIDIWKPPAKVGSPVDLRLSPSSFDVLISQLEDLGLRPEILINDIQLLINHQTESHQRVRRSKSAGFYNGAYYTLEEIKNWMNAMTENHYSRAELFTVTQSYEGRSVTGIKITSSSEEKPGFWIQGGIHGSEWISTATVLFIANEMLDRYESDTELAKVVDMFHWYFVPVTNVDGYVYTWQHDRLWRKTRSHQANGCYGVDPSRNWDMQFGMGCSGNPCSDNFCGPSAFSEVEVYGVADFILTIPNRKAFIDFQSYSQLWMSPWAYTADLPLDWQKQGNGSAKAAEALKNVYGTEYEVGTIQNLIYAPSGSSADWAYGKANILYSYEVQLRDRGQYGFLLPPEQIIPSGEETLQALRALATNINDN